MIQFWAILQLPMESYLYQFTTAMFLVCGVAASVSYDYVTMYKKNVHDMYQKWSCTNVTSIDKQWFSDRCHPYGHIFSVRINWNVTFEDFTFLASSQPSIQQKILPSCPVLFPYWTWGEMSCGWCRRGHENATCLESATSKRRKSEGISGGLFPPRRVKLERLEVVCLNPYIKSTSLWFILCKCIL